MSRSGGFCPRCGNPLERDEGRAAASPVAAREARLCSDCFRERLELVDAPEELTIRLCTNCGAIVREGNWVDVDDDYTDVAIEAVGNELRVHRAAEDVRWGVEPVQRGPNELELRLSVTGIVDGESTTEEHAVVVRISRETCGRCGKIAGDSYAGTVQVRAADRRPTDAETDRAVEIAHDVVDVMRETGDREAFVTEVTERPEGVDVRVSTNKIGGKIATSVIEELGGTYETSETLVTEDGDGRGVYRVAYAIRLPRVRPGDIVDHEGNPSLVERAASRFELRDLATGETITASDDEMAADPVIGSVDDTVETTVVAPVDERSVQVLDPRNYETRTIPRPSDFPTTADEIPVFKHGEELFALPAEGAEDDV